MKRQKKVEDTTPSTLSASEQEEVYDFFCARDDEAYMTAKEIAVAEAVELAMYGTMDRYNAA